MKKIITKSKISSLCLFSLFLLCSVFASENAYCSRHWSYKEMGITYDNTDRSFSFKFLIYDFKASVFDEQSFALNSELLYSEDGEKYNKLIALCNDEKSVDDVEWSEIFMKTSLGKLEFPDSHKVEKRGSKTYVGTKITETQRKEGYYFIKSKTAYITVKWYLPESIKSIHSFKYLCDWIIKSTRFKQYKVDQTYRMNQDKANSNAMQKATDDNVKVTGGTDAIIVKGTETGENIKVYSFSGVELKSVVAKDDVVNIDLPKNQNYIIKAGQKAYKVAM